MKTQYTDQAQTAIMYAERIARRCRHNYIGTEHLLMGLVHEEHGTAGMVLREQEVGEAYGTYRKADRSSSGDYDSGKKRIYAQSGESTGK